NIYTFVYYIYHEQIMDIFSFQSIQNIRSSTGILSNQIVRLQHRVVKLTSHKLWTILAYAKSNSTNFAVIFLVCDEVFDNVSHARIVRCIDITQLLRIISAISPGNTTVIDIIRDTKILKWAQ